MLYKGSRYLQEIIPTCTFDMVRSWIAKQVLMNPTFYFLPSNFILLYLLALFIIHLLITFSLILSWNSFIHSFINFLIFIHSFIRPFVRSSIHLFIHSSIHPSIRPVSAIHSSIFLSFFFLSVLSLLLFFLILIFFS